MVDGRELFQDAHAVSACKNDDQLEMFVEREEELVELYLQVNPAKATDAGSILANYDFDGACSALLDGYKTLPDKWLPEIPANPASLTLPDVLKNPLAAATFEQLPEPIRACAGVVTWCKNGQESAPSMRSLIQSLGLTGRSLSSAKQTQEEPDHAFCCWAKGSYAHAAPLFFVTQLYKDVRGAFAKKN